MQCERGGQGGGGMQIMKHFKTCDLFQACTELALPAGSNNKTDMFPSLPWTPEMRAEYCQEKWGVAQRPGWSAIQLWGKGWFEYWNDSVC